ncbi:hypothetical protein L2E82_31691 [Cichorium intybus]|uniref:Uncharacterized protein n=1 Tax=Cichorium intybus TaxID=13427 RepID=A0ACB9BFI9_CICIN|nr:hypothetical protein L2E82_31691 [Cichorium intybus]
MIPSIPRRVDICLVRAYVLKLSVRSELDISRRVLERTWIGVEGSSRAPTIESTGSAFESGVRHEGSKELSIQGLEDARVVWVESLDHSLVIEVDLYLLEDLEVVCFQLLEEELQGMGSR